MPPFLKSRTAIVLALALVFASGAVAGWSYGRREVLSRNQQRTPPRPEDMQRRVLADMQRDLQLTPEQQAQVEPIVRETWEKVSEVQRATGRQVREMFKAQHQRLKPLLTDAQWTKLQEIDARRARRHGGGQGTNAPSSTNQPPLPPPPGPPPLAR